MRFIQPPVTPPPADINLEGKTAIVTGATEGIGQETARQLLVKSLLLADPAVRSNNPNAVIKIMKVDMESFKSVKDFTETVKAEVPILDLLVLNAGIAAIDFQLTPDGYERITQVNYLSNALLLLELLPLLKATAIKTGSPSRVTWLGSRRHYKSSLESTKPLAPDSTVLGHFNDKDNFFAILRYGDSKLLCTMFMYELAERVDRKYVVINQLCPGMIHTGMGNFLVLPLRVLFHIVHGLLARSVEQAGWIVINALIVAGPESHGEFLLDKDIQPRHSFIESAAGQEMQKKLWTETVEEVSNYTKVEL